MPITLGKKCQTEILGSIAALNKLRQGPYPTLEEDINDLLFQSKYTHPLVSIQIAQQKETPR